MVWVLGFGIGETPTSLESGIKVRVRVTDMEGGEGVGRLPVGSSCTVLYPGPHRDTEKRDTVRGFSVYTGPVTEVLYTNHPLPLQFPIDETTTGYSLKMKQGRTPSPSVCV